MCIYGYLDTREAEIIFASPKINHGILEGLMPCIDAAQKLLDQYGFDFKVRVIANDDFKKMVLDPILIVSDGVADTNELFIRSYKMIQMFEGKEKKQTVSVLSQTEDTYGELKVGKLAQIIVRGILESGKVSEEEVEALQEKEYSKKILNQSRPVLVKAGGEFDRVRYYKEPIKIFGSEYLLCSQWAEGEGKNDRPYLLKWISEHQ